MPLTGFQRPKKLEVDASVLTPTYGKFVTEPFERGFGITIGNAMRRTLLSAIPGAAITSVRIPGVYHEFSVVPGVVEDVTDIILNLKQVVLKLYGDGTKTVYTNSDKKGGELRAGDIITDADVEILNPDQLLATLDEGISLKMELSVDRGRGYFPAEQNKKEGLPIDVLPIDAIFSPIKRANFRVENIFLGQRVFDRLVLEVWTNSSISPQDAVAAAAKILREQWTIFIDFENDTEEEQPQVDENLIKMMENLDRSVSELELSVRSYNCLKNANIRSIRDLVQKTESDMLKTKNFGRKSLNEIKDLLSVMGLSLGISMEEFSKQADK